MKKVAIIGYGAIARATLTILSNLKEEGPQIVGILEKKELSEAARSALRNSIPVVEKIDDLLARDPELIAEIASREAVYEYGQKILDAGKDLLVISVGSLADPDLFERLKSSARKGGAKLLIPSGALGAIDSLVAARLGGLTEVRQTLSKPPQAWKGTPAESILNLDGLIEAKIFFTGPAREAATQYPQNANVAATVALAGLGFENSHVQLIADPALKGPVHRIEAVGTFGSFKFELRGISLPDNPKSSAMAAFSIARALVNYSASVVI